VLVSDVGMLAMVFMLNWVLYQINQLEVLGVMEFGDGVNTTKGHCVEFISIV